MPRAIATVSASAGGGDIPAAVSGTGWSAKSSWSFGTAPGNNIGRFTDWLRAGWFMDPTPTYLNDECQTYNTRDLSDGNANFQAFADHCDIVALWHGGTIASARGNGSISSLLMRYDVPFANAIGYYELTCKVPSVSGAWPAWWTLGHQPGSAKGSYTWGPEIDILEFYDTKTRACTSTLHASRKPNHCFTRDGGDPPGTPATPDTVYEGNRPWNSGDFVYTPGFDFADGYHRFGVKIDRDYAISLWIDDVKTGTFASTQYCDDGGNPVAVELLVNLALGTHNPSPVESIHVADFGGVDNAAANNRFRFSLKNIQIWGA